MSSVIKFDKSFHPVVLYENYLICTFMNISENLKTGEELIGEKLLSCLRVCLCVCVCVGGGGG